MRIHQMLALEDIVLSISFFLLYKVNRDMTGDAVKGKGRVKYRRSKFLLPSPFSRRASNDSCLALWFVVRPSTVSCLRGCYVYQVLVTRTVTPLYVSRFMITCTETCPRFRCLFVAETPASFPILVILVKVI